MSKQVMNSLELTKIKNDSLSYVPSEEETEYMSEKQLNYFKDALVNARKEIILGSIRSLEAIREASGIMPDENDSATAESNIAVTIKIRENSIDLLAKIDHAIAKIHCNEYGYCEETGEEIGVRRLKVSPLALYSLEVQEKREKQIRRSWDNDNFMQDE